MEESDQKPKEIKVRAVILEAWNNVKNAFVARKEIFTVIGLIAAITGLFLNISSEDPSLKKVQALFLSLFTLIIVWLIVSVILDLLRGKHSELYYAISSVFIYIGVLLVINLFRYLSFSFGEELVFYLKWLGIPIIAIAANLLSIYFFKFVLKRNVNIEKEDLIQWFFLVTLNIHLVFLYISNDFKFVDTLKNLVSVNFSNLQILYFFLIAIYIELYLEKKIDKIIKNRKKRAIFSFFIFVTLLLLPLFIKYILQFLVARS